MPAPLRIIVEGVPVAKGRPRFTTVNGFAASYTPKKTQNYENWVRMCGVQSMSMAGRSTMDDALDITIIAHVPIPSSWSGKRKRKAALGEISPTKRPDLDNFVKAAVDGLTGIVWRDDSQIVNLTARKLYGETPKLVITVEQIA
ncbi:MAG: RusA family crossover junction endodeoxyribonuclease [Geminicoccaceae bacterium]